MTLFYFSFPFKLVVAMNGYGWVSHKRNPELILMQTLSTWNSWLARWGGSTGQCDEQCTTALLPSKTPSSLLWLTALSHEIFPNSEAMGCFVTLFSFPLSFALWVCHDPLFKTYFGPLLDGSSGSWNSLRWAIREPTEESTWKTRNGALQISEKSSATADSRPGWYTHPHLTNLNYTEEGLFVPQFPCLDNTPQIRKVSFRSNFLGFSYDPKKKLWFFIEKVPDFLFYVSS